MNRHPGGAEHTRRMISLARLSSGSKVLDMGAGDGEAVRILRSLGYNAAGIDLEPRSGDVAAGDFLHTDYADGSFDGVLSQCAFYISGSQRAALREAYRLLRRGGVLMLSDVWFENAAEAVEGAGFTVMHCEDMTAEWREYYIESLWRDESGACCGIRGRCTYEMLVCSKE